MSATASVDCVRLGSIFLVLAVGFSAPSEVLMKADVGLLTPCMSLGVVIPFDVTPTCGHVLDVIVGAGVVIRGTDVGLRVCPKALLDIARGSLAKKPLTVPSSTCCMTSRVVRLPSGVSFASWS